MAFATIVALPTAANAAEATLSTTITSSEPTYVHRVDKNGWACADGGVSTRYRVIKATLKGAAASQLTATVTPTGFKANMVTYQGVFMPSEPLVNCYGAVTGATSGAPVSYRVFLSALSGGFTEQDFFFAVAGETAADLGAFSIKVVSTNATSVTLKDVTYPDPVTDTTPPVISVPGNTTVEATSSAGTSLAYGTSAVDAIDGAVPVTCSPASGSTFGIGTTTVTCTAKDSKNNSSTKSFTVKVQDTKGPVISAVANKTIEATSSAGAVATYTVPTASDAVDGSRAVTCLPAVGATIGFGVTTVNCSSVDTRSNSSISTFNLTVQDTDAPVVGSVSNQTVEATSAAGATVNFSVPTASDAIDGVRPVTCTRTSGSTFAIGSTTVTCSATDTHANTGSSTFTVKVQDTTKPVLTSVSDKTHEATAIDGASVTYVKPTASDAVSGYPAVTCTPASGGKFALGETTVTCSATDRAGNTGTTSFKVAVEDTTKPAFSAVSDKTVEATGLAGAEVSYTKPTATDRVDDARAVTCSPASGGTFAIGYTTVTCSASDTRGNTATTTLMVAVKDTTGPQVAPVADIAIEATGRNGAAVSFTKPTATDLVDGDRSVTCSRASGATFAIGDTTVTCSASDKRGNEGSSSFKVIVADTTAPVISGLADTGGLATSAAGGVVTFRGAAVDLVDGGRTLTCSPASGSVFELGTTTVTCSATDTRSNLATKTFNVLVVKNTFDVLNAVTISGTPKVGQVLTASDSTLAPSLAGAEASHEWLRDDDVIDGATDETYTLAGADVSHSITHRVTFTAGGYNDVVKTSNVIGPVAKGDIAIGAVKVVGTAQVGKTLTVEVASVSPADSAVTYRWMSGDDEIGTGDEYVVEPGDVGHAIKVIASATRTDYEDVSKTSAETLLVIKGVMTTTSSLSLSGQPKVGGILTATGGFTVNPRATGSAIQWWRGSTLITGAVSSTYTLTNADAGSTIRFTHVLTRAGYEDANVSASTATAVDGGIITLDKPVISGSAVVDQVLTASVATPDPADVDVAYEWFVGEDSVGNGSTYTVKPGDVTKAITVKASATKDYFDDVSKTSLATAEVAKAEFTEGPSAALAGVFKVGEQLTALTPDAVPLQDSFTYQWFADDEPLEGAVGPTFDLTIAHKDKEMSVKVTAIRDGYVDAPSTAVAPDAVVTNVAPDLTLKSSASKLRLGKSATLSWTSLDAVSIEATGGWSGVKSESGSIKVTPSATGNVTYTLRATNGSGTTTAQVAVAVSLPAKKVAVSAKKSVRADKKLAVKASGLVAGERYTIRLGGKVVATGKATNAGKVSRSVRVPSQVKAGTRLLRVTGSLADRTGTRKVKVIRALPLKMTLADSSVRASDRQRVTVKGLLAGEKVTVTYQGKKISKKSAKANSKGVFTMTFSVNVNWGKKTVKAVAASDKRSVSKTFSVVNRCPQGGSYCR